MVEILSIGHSTLDYDQFVSRLKFNGVTAVADVRTSPFSRNFPQFNRDVLKVALAEDAIAYVFLGRELGGRPAGREYYTGGVADYEKMARAPLFCAGLDRLEEGTRKYRVAIMCSERNPMDCHRCLLVGRALAGRGIAVLHIVSDHETVSHAQIEAQLLDISGKRNDDMFASSDERLNDAYRSRSRKVAFTEIPPASPDKIAAE